MTMGRLALWVLAAFVASIPAENGITLPGVGSLSRMIGLVAFAVGALSLFRGGRFSFRPLSLFVVVAFLFVFWSGLTYFWSVAPLVTLSKVFTLAQLFTVVWLVWQFCRSDEDADLLMQAFVLGCYVTIVVALATFFGSPEPGFRNVGNFNPNTFSIVCALGIPMAWMLSLRQQNRLLVWLDLVYPSFAVVAIVLAASRGGLVTGIVALSVIPAAMLRMGPIRRLALFAMIAATTWAAFVFGPQLYPELQRNIERLSTTTEELAGGTLTGRTTIWDAAMELFGSAPVGGIGSGAFAYAAEPLLGRFKAPHNAFLAVASETGLVGLLLYGGLLLAAFLSVVSVDRSRRVLLLVLYVTLLVGMLPTNSENDKFTWFVLAILAVQRPLVLVPSAWRSEATSPVADAPPLASTSLGD